MFNREQMVAEIAKEVVSRLQSHINGGTATVAPAAPAPSGRDGVFDTVDEAAKAAAEAQKKVAALSLEDRGKMISFIKRTCEERARRGIDAFRRPH